MTDTRASVIVNLTGNLPRQAGQFGRSIDSLSRNGERSMGRFARSIKVVDRGLGRLSNRYTAFLTGAAGVGAGKGVIELDAQLKDLAVTADITDEQLAGVKDRLMAIANQSNIRVDVRDLLTGVKEIVAKTGELDVAMANLETMGLTMRATGADGKDAGALIADFYKKFQIDSPLTMRVAIDTMGLQGKEGAFELGDLSAQGNSVTPVFANLGRDGLEGVKEMGAILQIIRQTSSSAEETATVFERMISALTVENVELLQGAGIQVWDPVKLAQGEKVARSIFDIITELLVKTNADPEVLGKIFDVRALRGINAFALEFRQNDGVIPSIEKFMAILGDGNKLMSDSARQANTAKAALRSLSNTFGEVANERLSDPLQGLAEQFDAAGQETAKSLVDGAVTATGIVGGVLLARKLGVGKLIGKAFGKKGGAGGLASALPGAPTPVWVVNMPGGGGLPGTVVGNAASKVKGAPWWKGVPHVSKLALLGAGVGAAGVTAAGAAGYYGGGRIINNAIDSADKNFNTNIADSIGAAVTKALAAVGNDNAQEALALRERAAQSEVTIRVEGPGRVTRMRAGDGTELNAEHSLGESMVQP